MLRRPPPPPAPLPRQVHFEAAGVPLAEYREIKCGKCAAGAGAAWGYPYMLKSKT